MCLSSLKPKCSNEKTSFLAYVSRNVNILAYSDNCTVDGDGNNPLQEEFDDRMYDNDYENISFINEIWLIAEPSEIIMKTSIFLPIVLWGVFGNGLLIYVLFKNRLIRSPTNLLIGNMAAADLCSLLIHPWVVLVYEIFQNYELGSFGCKADGALECALLLCSVLNLCAISYDRLTAIVLPHENRLNRKSVKIVMASTWIAGFIVAIPLFVYRTYRERQWLDFLEKYCTEDTMIINIYWHVIITMMFWVPLTVLLMCYISIFIKLCKYEKIVLKTFKTIQVKYKKKVAKTMFIVVFTFMVCHVPLTVLIFYRNQLLKAHRISSSSNSVQNQVNGAYKVLWFTSKLCIFINAAINPIIYGFMNENFRTALSSIPLSRWLFSSFNSKPINQIIDEKKEPQNNKTKETSLPSKSKQVFIIYGGIKTQKSKIQKNDQ